MTDPAKPAGSNSDMAGHDNTDTAVTVDIEETVRFVPRFGPDGLMPCIASDAETGATLMLAWVNEEAIRRTLETGLAHYWSRSRKEMWKKGESSGALQRVVDIRIDCDQDTLLYRVKPRRRQATCHTGRETCFYRKLEADGDTIILALDSGSA